MIKKLSAIFCAFSLLYLSAFAQEKQNVVIDLKQKSWYVENKAEKNIINLTELPSTLMLVFPDDDFTSYQIQFFDDKSPDKFIVGYGCKGNSCINIATSDIINNSVTLRFQNGSLYKVGTHGFDSPKKINIGKGGLQLKLISPETPDEKPPVSKAPIQKEKTICDLSSTENQTVLELDKSRSHYHYLCNENDSSDKGDNCAAPIPSQFNYKFMTPCLDKKGNAVTASYLILYDASSTSRPYTIVEFKKAGDYEHPTILKSPFRPNASKEMVVTVIGEKDSIYDVTTVSSQNFMEDEASFAASLTGHEDSSAVAKPVKSKSDSAANTNDSLMHAAPLDARELKGKMVDLKNDLTRFNTQVYPVIDFVELQYKRDRACLLENMYKILGIEIGSTPEEVADQLIQLITPVAHKNYADFCQLIAEIKTEYEEAINKKTKYFLISRSVQIPPQDEFKLTITTQTGRKVFDPKPYSVSGGLKIDFSTGFFLSGISASDFVVSPQMFRFKGTRDTILSNGRDSTIYTGSLQDTTMNVIRKNNKLTFGTGFYMHFYRRSGKAFNAGGSAGIILDNTGQIQFLLGGSLMLNTGPNRIAFVGGFAYGRQKDLSSENQQYYWNGKNTVVNSKFDLPKNYTGTNPATYDSWKLSWYIGLTFNFASKTVVK